MQALASPGGDPLDLPTSALELQAVSMYYRFITFKHFARWSKLCSDARVNRLKIRKVRKVIEQNNLISVFRSWAVHCQTLRHRRLRLIQINAYFKLRTLRNSYQKWKALTRKVKWLMYPELCKQEETADRLRKIQLLRFAFRHFAVGARASRREDRALRIMAAKKGRLVLRCWLGHLQAALQHPHHLPTRPPPPTTPPLTR